AWSAASLSPRPIHRAAAMAAASVMRTSSRVSSRSKADPSHRWGARARPLPGLPGAGEAAPSGPPGRTEQADLLADPLPHGVAAGTQYLAGVDLIGVGLEDLPGSGDEGMAQFRVDVDLGDAQFDRLPDVAVGHAGAAVHHDRHR